MTSSEFSSEAPGPDPLAVFLEWYRAAAEHGEPRPDALALATATRDGRPSVRIVLFKGIESGAVRFVTNYHSRKGEELAKNPHAAIVFFWPRLDRQVRMEGRVQHASERESDEYFASRDRESQLGAWASQQSTVVGSRVELDAELERVRARFAGKNVERPAHWGILRLVPERVELWLGGAHRLHDRFAYEQSDGGWRCSRLAP